MVNSIKNEQGQPVRILIADGNLLRAIGLARLLQEMGFTLVGPTSTRVEAVALAKQEELGLAIIDMNLSGSASGIAVAKEITRLCQVPCLLMAAPDYIPSRVLQAVEDTLNRHRKLQHAA